MSPRSSLASRCALLAALLALAVPAAASANVLVLSYDTNAHPGGNFQTATGVTVTGTLTVDGTTPINGASVAWTVSGANPSPASPPPAANSATTDFNGQFTIAYTATNAGSDFVEAWEDPNANLALDVGEASDTTTLTIGNGQVILAGPTQFQYNGPTPTQSVTATDGNGVAVPDASIRYTITGANPTSTTGSNPTPTGGTITWPGSNIGSDTITAYYDANGNGVLDPATEPSDVRSITISAGTVDLSGPGYFFTDAGGGDVTLFLYDGAGNALANKTVSWTLTGTNPTSGSATTGSFGEATIHLPGTLGGSSLLTATYDDPGTTQDPSSSLGIPWYPRIRPGGSGISSIVMGPDQWCQVEYTGDTSPEFFGSYPGSCATYLRVGATTYGYFGETLSPRGDTSWSGSGSAADPYALQVSSDVGNTGLIMQSTIRYVTGEDFYRQDVTITNNGAGAQEVVVAQYADCYLQNSDSGYGFLDPATGGAYCTANPNNSPAGRLEGFVPLSPGSSSMVDGYSTVHSQVFSTGTLPNTCQCTAPAPYDNGMAIAFPASVPAGGSATRSFLVTFSPTGATPDLAGPVVTVTGPASGGVTTDAQPLLTGAAGSAPTDVPHVTAEIFAGASAAGAPVQSFTAPVSSGTWAGRPGQPLAPGTYTVRASQQDTHGNVGTSAPSTFTVRAAPPPSAPPPPPPSSAPPPVPNRSGNLRPISGTVCVILPGQSRCIPIDRLQSIPVGTIIDTTKGVVELTVAADTQGKTQTGRFNGGQFLFTQGNEVERRTVKRKRAVAGAAAGRKRRPTVRNVKVLVTKLALRGGPNPRRTCPRGTDGAAAKRRFVRYLQARAQGRFRVIGRRSSGIERGTEWTTRDTCAGTLTKVTEGAVLVTDFAKRKTILVRAGRQYLATGRKAAKRRRR